MEESQKKLIKTFVKSLIKFTGVKQSAHQRF